jgi:3-phenylpropionate/trans-cinnamate dioxygenase ferredoxin reductase subunit
LRRVVIVGASLAGLAAMEALRQEGFDGAVVAVGAEPHLPYDRPPLSKQVLQGSWGPEKTALREPDRYQSLDVEWRLGRRAARLDLEGRRVVLDDGEAIPVDGLVVATGASPRRLPGTPPLAGIHVLRTLDDCLAIVAELDAGPKVCVVGTGFIGAEVAASCRQRGLEVTALEALDTPMAMAFPAEMGRTCAALHLDHGVDLRCRAMVAGFEGEGRVERVLLADGSAVEADVVVVGIGVVPETGWLEGSGLTLENGVVCDATLAAAPGVVAAGDVARWPLGGQMVRIEHWTNATEQGAAAGRRLLAADGEAQPFAPVPYVWSDQYDTKIQVVGLPRADDEMAVVDGTLEERRFVACFGREGRLTGAVAFNRPRLLVGYRRLLADGASFEDALAHATAAS